MQAFSHRAVWQIAAPMILSNLSIPLLGMVDSGVAGHLPGPSFLGAVAVGATIFSFLFMGLNFLRMGTTGMTAQAFGADMHDVIRETLWRGVLIALVLAAAIILLQAPLRDISIYLIAPAGEVKALVRTYFDIRVWSAPAVLVNFAMLGWFLGLQNARIPLLLLFTVNLTNMALDILFVVGLGYQVDGIAAASVIAEYTGLVVGLFFVRREIRKYPGSLSLRKLVERRELLHTVHVNGNILVRTLCLMFSFAFFTAMSARQGELILAANALLLNLQTFMAYGLDGFAHAAEALVGRALGMQKRTAIELAVKRSLQWSLLVAMMFSLGYALLGNPIIALLTDIDSVRQTAAVFLWWMVLSPLVSVWSFLYDGVFIGATWAHEMRNAMIFATFLVFVPAWYLAQPLGNHGLWLAFLFFMAARGVGMHLLYRLRLGEMRFSA